MTTGATEKSLHSQASYCNLSDLVSVSGGTELETSTQHTGSLYIATQLHVVLMTIIIVMAHDYKMNEALSCKSLGTLNISCLAKCKYMYNRACRMILSMRS